MDHNEIFIGLATIIVFGVGAQWVGRRVGIPSLLLLLPAGLLAGDVFGLVQPEELLGDLLFPLVSLLMSLLLFQAALQLRFSDLPQGVRSSVFRLVTVGMVVTFVGTSLAIMLLFDIPTEMAFLTGSILVVSGPTVVGPLLEVIRPTDPTGKILSWEGTTLDPIGAILGVVVLNLVLATDRDGFHPIIELLGRIGVGTVVGLAAAALLVFVMKNFLLTDDMEASVAVLFAVLAFTTAEVLVSEAGLLATVTLGIVIANQRLVSIDNITGFGETLEVMIIGILFILLASLVDISDSLTYLLPTVALTVILILIVRPLSTFASLAGTQTPRPARGLIAWMDPRGIVAAAIAAQFSVTLTANEIESEFLLPVVFGVILGTGVVYGLTAPIVAKVLGVAQERPKTIGLLGDDPWLAPFGLSLARAGVPVLWITNTESTLTSLPAEETTAPIKLILTQDGSQIVEEALRDAGLADVVIAFQPGEVHSWIIADVIEAVGRRHTLRVPAEPSAGMTSAVPDWWSNKLFNGEITSTELVRRLDAGATIEIILDAHAKGTDLLAMVTPDGRVNFRPNNEGHKPGTTLIGLVDQPTQR